MELRTSQFRTISGTLNKGQPKHDCKPSSTSTIRSSDHADGRLYSDKARGGDIRVFDGRERSPHREMTRAYCHLSNVSESGGRWFDSGTVSSGNGIVVDYCFVFLGVRPHQGAVRGTVYRQRERRCGCLDVAAIELAAVPPPSVRGTRPPNPPLGARFDPAFG